MDGETASFVIAVMCLNGAARHSASSPPASQRNKVRRWLDGWRKVRRGTLVLRFPAARKQNLGAGDGWALGGAIRVAALARCTWGGIWLWQDASNIGNWVWHLISCLFALERSHGPGSQQVDVPKRNSIMHSPGVPFWRSVLHCRGEQAIAHQDSVRSDMLFSLLLCR